jgi:hypothetical protein
VEGRDMIHHHITSLSFILDQFGAGHSTRKQCSRL